jgi:hypothetical protein
MTQSIFFGFYYNNTYYLINNELHHSCEYPIIQMEYAKDICKKCLMEYTYEELIEKVTKINEFVLNENKEIKNNTYYKYKINDKPMIKDSSYFQIKRENMKKYGVEDKHIHFQEFTDIFYFGELIQISKINLYSFIENEKYQLNKLANSKNWYYDPKHKNIDACMIMDLDKKELIWFLNDRIDQNVISEFHNDKIIFNRHEDFYPDVLPYSEKMKFSYL